MGTGGHLTESQSSGIFSANLLQEKTLLVMMCLNSSKVLLLYFNK